MKKKVEKKTVKQHIALSIFGNGCSSYRVIGANPAANLPPELQKSKHMTLVPFGTLGSTREVMLLRHPTTPKTDIIKKYSCSSSYSLNILIKAKPKKAINELTFSFLIVGTDL